MQPQILRNQVKSHLLGQIQRGELKVGKTINLALLARTIGVSVTPIREALSQLEQSRVISAVPNRGFIVPQLSRQEAKNLYETIAQLEITAVESSVYTEYDIEALRNQQLLLQQSHTPMRRLEARLFFHQLLVRNCPNSVLLQILDDLKTRLRFYEQMHVRDASFYENVDNQNEAIIRAIEENNVPTAALILKMNWMVVLEYLEKQLAA
ncbi:GntR family transcriptional regulator [Muricauda sp. 2012CJ35-5]|uniref:GntR family transcriptional regulator n=1 Tax=Flagellimonas spongiicola TaxID=2942208 RepID=A0ABT0PQA5_9FLAO|nr:GntR family transcriptional regulator [Allomuricauda spongiicola]MCL6273396.1 GntR family transcriptional regulator [Allomuricauda spongiicola]